ncbi:MAG TPA: peptidoglycan bridge formation glycyltransferase FemA/FemB family protein [Longilinea sp.]|nr:peptidoglycan bridge formation glycyltransferase FemA/FemB family protein [Longilinea sp.]
MTILNRTEWDAFLTRYPQAHLLQTGDWGDLKIPFGWCPERIQIGENGAQILFRRLPLGYSIAYIPKGPLGKDWTALWPEIDRLCRHHRAIFLKVEPDAWVEQEVEYCDLFDGFSPSASIQPRRTIVVDLTGDEDAILARMKQKTRYNIRLAQKKEVVVRESSDLEEFQRLMETTSSRDNFGVHSLEYYQRAFQLFSASGRVALLQAEFQGKALAALMVFAAGERAWYLYGASSDEERNRMPAYLLQWEAMRWAVARGCRSYDLWGIPDEDEEILESQFESRSDNLWGVYRFKRGFGGRLMRSACAWDKIYQPILYRAYQRFSRQRSES